MVSREAFIHGRQAVQEALIAGNIKKIYLLKGQRGTVIQDIISLAQKSGIRYDYLNAADFECLSMHASVSGGVLGLVSPFNYLSLEQLLDKPGTKDNNSLVLVLDHIEDPHNLGALLRTAVASGAAGVVIPSDRAAGITSTVRKVAAGAVEWVPVARVTNLARAADRLKEKGFWIYGAEGESETPYYRADWKRSVALVLGSEGKGISRLIRKKCDLLIGVPMTGRINSLNVSVAGGIIMYEHYRQKMA